MLPFARGVWSWRSLSTNHRCIVFWLNAGQVHGFRHSKRTIGKIVASAGVNVFLDGRRFDFDNTRAHLHGSRGAVVVARAFTRRTDQCAETRKELHIGIVMGVRVMRWGETQGPCVWQNCLSKGRQDDDGQRDRERSATVHRDCASAPGGTEQQRTYTQYVSGGRESRPTLRIPLYRCPADRRAVGTGVEVVRARVDDH